MFGKPKPASNSNNYPDRPAFWSMGEHMFSTYGLKGDDWASFDDNNLVVSTYRMVIVEFGYNEEDEPQYSLGFLAEPPPDTIFYGGREVEELDVINKLFMPLSKPATPKFKPNDNGYKVELNFYISPFKTGFTLYWLKYHPLPEFLKPIAPRDYQVTEYTGNGNLSKMPRWNGIVWGNAIDNNSSSGGGSNSKKAVPKPPPTNIPSDEKPVQRSEGIPSDEIPLADVGSTDDMDYDF